MLPPDHRWPIEAQFDAADPDAEAKSKAAQSLRADQHRAVELSLIVSPQARDWTWQFLADCRTFEAIIHDTAGYAQGFEDGRRHVGVDLMVRLARANPEHFARMFVEHP
jgi:hypothetical protein